MRPAASPTRRACRRGSAPLPRRARPAVLFHGLPRAVVADPVRHAPAVGVRVDAQGPAGRRVVVVRAEAGVLVLGDGLVGRVAAAVGLVEGVEGRRRRRRVEIPAHALRDDGVNLVRPDRLRDGGGVVAAAPRRVRRTGAGQAQQAVEPERRPDSCAAA